MNKEKHLVICFGEVLWDNIPTGRKPGGAPMNVAYHLNKLGLDGRIISRLGNDNAGKELLNEIKSLGLGAEYCQIDQVHKTSAVDIRINRNREAAYDIHYPVAWDFIAYEKRFSSALKEAKVFVFGSLAGRSQATRTTLERLVEEARYRVFDVNLRAPYYDERFISCLLGKTDLLKLNIDELKLITGWYGGGQDDRKAALLLMDKFSIPEMIVTRGSEGASFYTRENQVHQAAYHVEVRDTVGAGDSFLAGFLSKRIAGAAAGEALKFAAAVAAFVTTQSGACPAYNREDLEVFTAKINGASYAG